MLGPTSSKDRNDYKMLFGHVIVTQTQRKTHQFMKKKKTVKREYQRAEQVSVQLEWREGRASGPPPYIFQKKKTFAFCKKKNRLMEERFSIYICYIDNDNRSYVYNGVKRVRGST